MRGTGGNQFVDNGITIAAFVAHVWERLNELDVYARDSGRALDLAQVDISTKRVGDRISVTVTADLEEGVA
jgi:hypothetical protein